MFSLERPCPTRPGLTQLARDFGPTYAGSGLIGFIFAATGPVAIVLAVGSRGGLSEAQLASWLFGSFFINGLLTLTLSWLYRSPLVFFWTIPGTVLVGPALTHLSFAEVCGAFIMTGALMTVLGLTGWFARLMRWIPMPIVMAMVAGVFLKFGLDVVYALRDDLAVAAPMVVMFMLLSARPALARFMPPVIGALLAGALASALTAQAGSLRLPALELAAPVFSAPELSWQAMVELVVPLAITVLVVQNGQGFAVLTAAGHKPPVNSVTVACGLWSMLAGLVGTACTCLTGPTNAIVVGSGERGRHYTAALFVGLLALFFGLFSTSFTQLMLAAPSAFVATLAGLAMLKVLQGAFVASFRTRFTLGALVSFIVTVANVPIAGVGAPFWGLVFGFATSWLLERDDFQQEKAGGL